MRTVAWSSQSANVDFIHGIWPIYLLSRTFGLWPFSIIANANGMIQRSQFRARDALWFLISMGLFIEAFNISIQGLYPFLIYSRYGTISTIGYSVFELTNHAFGIVAIVFDLFNRKQLAEILQGFSDFDNQVSRPEF